MPAVQEPSSDVRRSTFVRRAYRCRCGSPIFFPNTSCLCCGSQLGYEPRVGYLYPLRATADPDLWELEAGGEPAPPGAYRRCANLETASGCNWLLDANATGQTLCMACRLNRMIPDQSDSWNRNAWNKIEGAKRRVISSLIALGLPVKSRITEDPERGLEFHFLKSQDDDRVMTGHADGVITLNIEEADDAARERTRQQMGEPYRTLVGHLRHELGHYYWDLLVDNSPWLEKYRQVFGDERADYSEALKRNYQDGPPPDWPQHFVSSYASVHPWEDWAETWAHYLHMVDTLHTAQSFGLDASQVNLECKPFGSESLSDASDPEGPELLSFLNSWTRLTALLNELSRAMGQPDFYPFVLPVAAVAKLHLIHQVVTDAAGRHL